MKVQVGTAKEHSDQQEIQPHAVNEEPKRAEQKCRPAEAVLDDDWRRPVRMYENAVGLHVPSPSVPSASIHGALLNENDDDSHDDKHANYDQKTDCGGAGCDDCSGYRPEIKAGVLHDSRAKIESSQERRHRDGDRDGDPCPRRPE